MKRSFSDLLGDHTRFIGKIVLNTSTDEIEMIIVMKTEIFPESTTVGISNRSTMTKTFEKNLTLEKNFMNTKRRDDRSEIMKNEFRCFSLSGTGFSYSIDEVYKDKERRYVPERIKQLFKKFSFIVR